jgi:exodeoxyribonuclease III
MVMAPLKIATYNVNSIRSRMHIVVPWLRENRPDILCMQETKVADQKFPAEAFENEGYHVAYRGDRQYNGVAVASLQKPDAVSFGLADQGPADEDRLMAVNFSGLKIINTYVPQGRDRETAHFVYKLEWFKRLKAFFERSFSPREPVVWCGDLNVARETIDVHDPKRILGHVDFNPDVWDAFDHVKSWGFIDLFRREHQGEPGQYTFFDYRVPRSVERKLGWRVDHILATTVLAERLSHCWIDMGPRLAEKPSDHTVMIAEFNKEPSLP